MTTSNLVALAIFAGLLLAFNPVILAVFTNLLLSKTGKDANKVIKILAVFLFLLALGCFYLALVIGWLILIGNVNIKVQYWLSLGLGTATIIWGIISLKHYHSYGTHKHIAINLSPKVHKHTFKQSSLFSTLILGIITGYATILSVGLPLLCIATSTNILYKNSSITNAIAFIAALFIPLIILLVINLKNIPLSSIIKRKEASKGTYRLGGGLTAIILAWLLLLVTGGVIGQI